MSFFSKIFQRSEYSGQASSPVPDSSGSLDNLVVLRDSAHISVQDVNFYYGNKHRLKNIYCYF